MVAGIIAKASGERNRTERLPLMKAKERRYRIFMLSTISSPEEEPTDGLRSLDNLFGLFLSGSAGSMRGAGARHRVIWWRDSSRINSADGVSLLQTIHEVSQCVHPIGLLNAIAEQGPKSSGVDQLAIIAERNLPVYGEAVDNHHR